MTDKEEIKQVVNNLANNLANLEFTVEDELEFCKVALKRKEFDYTELEKRHNDLKEFLNELAKNLIDCSSDFKELCRQLRILIQVKDENSKLWAQRCEELEQKIKSDNCSTNCYKYQENEKYKKALNSVKNSLEIIKKVDGNSFDEALTNEFDYMLQKIAEVEKDHIVDANKKVESGAADER